MKDYEWLKIFLTIRVSNYECKNLIRRTCYFGNWTTPIFMKQKKKEMNHSVWDVEG